MKVKLAIVGSSKAHEEESLEIIRDYIRNLMPDLIVSGECPKGGVDIYAREEATRQGIAFLIFPPFMLQWDGESGYKARNRKIVKNCTHLLRINSRRSKTFGSGWTANFARELGKTVFEEEVK